MRWRKTGYLAWVVGAVLLSACIFGGEEDGGGTNNPLPVFSGKIHSGYYHGSYGAYYDSIGYESELALDSNGRFRWFGIQANLALANILGRWTGDSTRLIGFEQSASFVDMGFLGSGPEIFLYFESQPADTFAVRKATDSSFERYEVAPDGRRFQWVPYRRTVLPALASTKYVSRDTSLVEDTAGDTVRVESRYEYRFQAGGSTVYTYYYDNKPQIEIETANWLQAGTFLVLNHPRRRFYVDSLNAFGAWYDTLEGEWVIRLRNVGATKFEWWSAYLETWYVFRKEP